MRNAPDIGTQVDQIYHLACPASPVFYQHNPIKTVKTAFQGTLNMCGLAKRVKACPICIIVLRVAPY